MLYRDVPGWSAALGAARQTWPWVPHETWDAVGAQEAPEGKLWVVSNEIYSAGMTAGIVKLRREYPR